MSVSDIRRRVAEKMGGGSTGDKLPCRVCDEPTERATLTDLGARCFRCYAAFCRDGSPDKSGPGQLTLAQKQQVMASLRGVGETPGPAWALKLRARHRAGEQLSPAQVAAYRDALRGTLVDDEAAA